MALKRLKKSAKNLTSIPKVPEAQSVQDLSSPGPGDGRKIVGDSKPQDSNHIEMHQRKRIKLAAAHSEEQAPVTTVSSANISTMTQMNVSTEDEYLLREHEVMAISIPSSSKIRKKVQILLHHLEGADPANPKAGRRAVVLRARAPVASKLISIVEIAKADIERRRGKWYQYTKLHPQLEEFKGRRKLEPRDETSNDVKEPNSKSNNDSATVDDDSGEEEDFEEMGHYSGGSHLPDFLSKPTVRNIPVISIFLTSTRIPGFKELYGYDTLFLSRYSS